MVETIDSQAYMVRGHGGYSAPTQNPRTENSYRLTVIENKMDKRYRYVLEMIDSWDYMVRGHGGDTHPIKSYGTLHSDIINVIGKIVDNITRWGGYYII